MQVTLRLGEQFPQITGAQSDEFAAELLRLEDSDFEEIVLDFAGVDYINSMAMGSIFALYQKLKEGNRQLQLRSVNDRIRRLFHVANLEDLVLPDEPAAG